jgi:hypothetical protein
MEDPAPDIKMQCPKCGRSFPMDVLYCDDCTVMLEPVEQEAAPPPPRAAMPETPAAGITPERMEDVALDTLKADVEQKFISTLLLELSQARKRLEKKEGALSGLMEKQPSMDHGDFVKQSGSLESGVDGLLKKVTRLETMLENLTEKIRADISGLEVQLTGLAQPGLAGAFSSSGRYYRMLSSELKTKRVLLKMLVSRRPPSFPTFGRMKTALIPVAALLLLAVSGLAVYRYLPEHKTTRTMAAAPADRQPSRVTEQEIKQLLDDIRKANLSKDYSLWESRYSASYLAQPGKIDGIKEQWAKVDYESLAYSVDGIKTGTTQASALVTWTMDVASKAGGMKKTVVQRLLADFIREGGVLKIASVSKQ